jgi:hypothetical protein
MYKVTSNDVTLDVFETLTEAMNFAKYLGIYVVIYGPEYEVCGMFGVDGVKDNLLPNGNRYEWMKRRKT